MTTSSIVTEATAFTSNASHLLRAQQLAVTARIAHHFSTENSVEVVITPMSSEWTFTVSCQMKYCDVVLCPSDEQVDGLLVDLVLPYVSVDELVSTVERTIEQARNILDCVLV